MPVNDVHADYLALLPAWQRARDVLAGEDAVKAAGEKYLARLTGQSDAEYAAYVLRASFFNAAGRTCAGYLGQIFRRPPDITTHGGDHAASFLGDCDLCGTSLAAYARRVVDEVCAVGRAGTLVDWADAEARAYLTLYPAEAITNWREERLDGRLVLTLVVLAERVEAGGQRSGVSGQRSEGSEGSGDEFTPLYVPQLRVLRLGAGGDGPREFQVQLWRQRKGRKGGLEWFLYQALTPLRRGKPLDFIPFVFHGPLDCSPACRRPVLDDVICVNLDHYRIGADYKHGMHFTALPTAWVSGFEKDAVLRIGSSTAWVAEAPGAAAGFLEFTGKGLTTFEAALQRDESLMAVLGARLLEGQKMVGESAQAIALRHAGQDNVLALLAQAVSDGLRRAMAIVWWWHGSQASVAEAEKEVFFGLNTDFTTTGMTAREIRELVTAWQASAISHETLLDAFRRGELLPAGRTDAEEQALIKAEGPARRAGLELLAEGKADGEG